MEKLIAINKLNESSVSMKMSEIQAARREVIEKKFKK